MSTCSLSSATIGVILCERGWLGEPKNGRGRVCAGFRRLREHRCGLEAGTVPRGTLWVEGVNAVTADIELGNIRDSV